MKKGHKYYDLEHAEIMYVEKNNSSYLKTKGDSSQSNNLGNIPETELSLSNGISRQIKHSFVSLKQKTWLSRILCTTGGALVCVAIILPITLTQCKAKGGEDKPVTPTTEKTLNIIGLTELLIPFKTTYEYKCNIDGATITAPELPPGFNFDGHTLTTPSSISNAGTFKLVATTNDGFVCSRTISYFSNNGQTFSSNKIILIEGGINNYWIEIKDVSVSNDALEFVLTPDDKKLTTGVYFSNLSGLQFTKIANSFLSACYALTSVDLSGFTNVSSIGDNFLSRCYALTSVDLSGFTNINSIGDYFLAYCNILTSVDLSAFTQVNQIGNNFLFSCIALTSVDLSGFTNVSSITDRFLYDCSALTSVDLSGFTNVSSIGNDFFYNCRSLTSVDLSGFTNVSSIGNDFFYNCRSLTSVDLSAFTQVNQIGNNFLFSCTALTSVDLSAFSSVASIGEDFLSGCLALTSVDLSVFTDVNSIGDYFLSSCRSLTSVDLSGFTDVSSIGNGFLYSCSALTSVDVGDKNYSTVAFGSSAMDGVANLSSNKIYGSKGNEFKSTIPNISN